MATIDSEDERDVIDGGLAANHRHTPDGRPTDSDERADSVVSYAEGPRLVLCDRANPCAWIRSDEVRRLDEMR